MVKEPLLDTYKTKGGFKTLPFIIGTSPQPQISFVPCINACKHNTITMQAYKHIWGFLFFSSLSLKLICCCCCFFNILCACVCVCGAANEAFEGVASFGLRPNMILYLTREFGMQIASAANVLFLWSAATNFMPILGAYLADSYVGRYRMIGFGSIVSLMVTISQDHPSLCCKDYFDNFYVVYVIWHFMDILLFSL